MIKSIKVKSGSIEDKILLFKNADFKKLNILFGANGVGKSTLLNGIINNSFDLDVERDIIIQPYINSKDNFKYRQKLDCKKMDILPLQEVNTESLSEGQSITYSLLVYLEHAKNTALNNPDKTIVIVIDEIDSLSTENINMISQIIVELYDIENIQIFVSSNHYHFVYVFKKVFNMYLGRETQLNSYEEYYKELSRRKYCLGKRRDFTYLNNTTLIF